MIQDGNRPDREVRLPPLCWQSVGDRRRGGSLGDNQEMVLEHAVLDVIPGREQDFEEAFDVAKSVISESAGFISLGLHRCVEHPSRYLLLVAWETLEAHIDGFRGSDRYEEWRQLLHHFYVPFPTVEHYQLLTSAEV
jgi:heme-degrading monooxygenase HmoA